MNQDEYKSSLETLGFKTEIDGVRYPENQCDWLAYRATMINCIECETNDDKPMQILVNPYKSEINGHKCVSSTIRLRGERSGIWFELRAYGIDWGESLIRMNEIERMLIKAWNAL